MITEPEFCLLRCVVSVAAPELLLHFRKLRLTVAEPHTCFAHSYVVTAFKFRGDGAWLRRYEDNMFEQHSEYVVVNLGSLRSLNEDMLVTVTWWAQRRSSAPLNKKFRDLLKEFPALSREQQRPALPRLTLQMELGVEGMWLGWLVPPNEGQNSRVMFDDLATLANEHSNFEPRVPASKVYKAPLVLPSPAASHTPIMPSQTKDSEESLSQPKESRESLSQHKQSRESLSQPKKSGELCSWSHQKKSQESLNQPKESREFLSQPKEFREPLSQFHQHSIQTTPSQGPLSPDTDHLLSGEAQEGRLLAFFFLVMVVEIIYFTFTK